MDRLQIWTAASGRSKSQKDIVFLANQLVFFLIQSQMPPQISLLALYSSRAYNENPSDIDFLSYQIN